MGCQLQNGQEQQQKKHPGNGTPPMKFPLLEQLKFLIASY
jgi:hypothetical protein